MWVAAVPGLYSNWAFFYGNTLPVPEKLTSFFKARSQDILDNDLRPQNIHVGDD